ncbi:MAG: ester cyclase [Gemmatimonadales bacterium]|nr:ester cyclase [Gemmatimonadales bacterium]
MTAGMPRIGPEKPPRCAKLFSGFLGPAGGPAALEESKSDAKVEEIFSHHRPQRPGAPPRLRQFLARQTDRGTARPVEPSWRQLIAGYRMQLRIEDLVADGDVVRARHTETGTFVARAFGHARTGRSYALVAMELFEIRDGRIARRRDARGSAVQMRQLGRPLA